MHKLVTSDFFQQRHKNTTQFQNWSNSVQYNKTEPRVQSSHC